MRKSLAFILAGLLAASSGCGRKLVRGGNECMHYDSILDQLPEPYCIVGRGEFDGTIVVGAQAPAEEIVSAVDIWAQFSMACRGRRVFERYYRVGGTQTVSLDGHVYELEMLERDLNDIIRFAVNGEITDYLAQGDCSTLEDNARLCLLRFGPILSAQFALISPEAWQASEDATQDGKRFEFEDRVYKVNLTDEIGNRYITVQDESGLVEYLREPVENDSVIFAELYNGVHTDILHARIINAAEGIEQTHIYPDAIGQPVHINPAQAQLDTEVNGIPKGIYVGTKDSNSKVEAIMANAIAVKVGGGSYGFRCPEGSVIVVTGEDEEEVREAARNFPLPQY